MVMLRESGVDSDDGGSAGGAKGTRRDTNGV
jgi:hypothetical protein